TAVRLQQALSKASCSVMSREHSRERFRAALGDSSWQTAARSFLMKLESCRRTYKSSCCGCFRNRSLNLLPLTTSELAALEKLPLNGVLEIVQLGKGGMRGAKKQVRIVLIMQRPVPSPVEFALPPEGNLIIVQMDDGWVFIPNDYTRSNKKIVIKPGRPNKT